ncbi:MAG: diguanylate cyclase response regulator [Oscillatoriales cyanobacterium CG2_30_44_21]|nr:MAG: diguanylate cyclase response regulator [Oscillatoriales cyanobacterium CG2_30_44_21]
MPEIADSHLLIVDDEPMNREVLLRHLRNSGYLNTTAVDSGQSCLDIVKSQPIDLILLDMMMPMMNGLEVLQHLKAHPEWRVIPVIVISALTEKEMMLSCIQVGAEDFLTKPYDRVLLRARVSACLEKKNLHDREVLNKQKLEAAYKELALAYYELEIVKNELEALSHRDGLTGIANRRYFDTVLEREWKATSREKTYLSLILFDIDYFKKYNDTYGHLAGDDCLCQVADASAQVVKRPRDTLARYGGEEFAVILPDTNAIGATICAERIRMAIEELQIDHIASEAHAHVTASLGISTLKPCDEITSFQRLIKEADLALYQAKSDGKNCVKMWEGVT